MQQDLSDSKQKEEFLKVYREGLLNDTLPFWTEHGIDKEQGGFFTSLAQDGTVIDTDKAVWPQGRFSWLLAMLYNRFEKREQWLSLAEHGIKFLDQHCIDPTDGRMWFQLTRSGEPLRKRRYAFSETFASIAYGEYALATGKDEYAEKAKKLFENFLAHQTKTEANPKYTQNRPMRNFGVPMMTIVTAQELRTSIQLRGANELIDQAIETIRNYHLNEQYQVVLETVGKDGTFLDHFEGRTLNPGHAIEGAWFVMQEGAYRNDQSLIDTGLRILDWMWEKGWDKEHGGILYFVDAKGLPVQEYWHDMKFWWPQCEAIIATLMAYQLTGNKKYAHWHQLIHEWAYRHFPDSEHGEWFGYLHRDGHKSTTMKGNIWKGPFHLPRMQWTCWQLLEETTKE